MKINLNVFLFTLFMAINIGHVVAQGPGFTYQGQLRENGQPVRGAYDLTFALFDASHGSNQVGPTLTNVAVDVAEGRFATLLDFGPEIFTGSERWLEIGVRTNGGGDFTLLNPRHLLAATPYSLMAHSASNLSGTLPATRLTGTLPSYLFSGVFSGALSFDNASNSFTGNGAGITGINPLNIAPGTANINISGNAAAALSAATAGSAAIAGNFTGLLTGDVTGAQTATMVERLRSVPLATNAPLSNQHLRYDGSKWLPGNVVLDTNVSGTLSDNRLSTNVALLNGTQAFVGTVSFRPSTGAPFAVGSSNKVTQLNADWLDGMDADSFWKVEGNSGSLPNSNFLGTTDDQPLEFRVNNRRVMRFEPTTDSPNVIGGWEGNVVKNLTGYYSPVIVGATIAGGGTSNGYFQRFTRYVPDHLEILSGTNYVSASFGTVSGGLGNGVGWRADLSSIGGGAGNLIGGVDLGPMGATIGGGIFNRIENNRSEPPGASQTIAGGECNSINTSGFTTISGGRSNRIGDDSAFSTIAGGCLNLIGHISPQATIGGGSGNGVWTWTGTISGGANNQVYQPGFGGSIGGGYGNIIRGAAAAIPGGRQNSAEGECSFAAGSHAIAYHSGAFVWADHSGVFFQSASSNEFAVRATGGVRFVTAIDTNGTPTAGVQVSAGGTGWSAVSDRNMKENFEAVDGKEVLEKVAALSIQRWNMKTQSDSVRHIGPMAQDFHAAFGLGEDNRHINSVDVDGVALAAIQGLNQAVEEKDAQIRALEKRLMELEKVVQKLIR